MSKLWFTKTYAAFLLGIVVLFCVSCGVESITPDTPAETKPWVSKGEGFKEWGPAANGIWATSSKPQTFEVWQWDQNTMVKQHEIALEWSVIYAAWLADDKYIAAMEINEKWPFILTDAKTGKQLQRWDNPPGWTYSLTGTSSNGKYLAMLAKTWRNYSYDGERIRLDLIDVNTLKLTETATLYDKYTEGYLGRPIVTDDGKYIGVPGWVNGAAVIDVEKRKALWSKVPPNANSLEIGAFSPDGKCMYVGGGCGHMVEMDTLTGKVLCHWLATDSKKSENGHHVTCIAVSPDGQYVASGTGPVGEIYIWSKHTKKIRKIVAGGGTTCVVSFSPDSQNLATFSPGAIKIWPRKDWEDKKAGGKKEQ
ncbi:MAG: WD40 repeat domain-containing protein [Planctomycetia bacterium]|jgi:WD40 repeat protein